jgi:DNA-binding MarR family transcriptional regulator
MTTSTRDERVRELIDEFGLRNPTRKMYAMRHWPSGRLSLVHLNVLMLLDEEGPHAMRALAEGLDVSQASATGIVDRMEQRGLVARERGEQDRRVVHVGITEEGRALIAGMAAERRDHMVTMIDKLTDEEIAGLLTGLRAFRRVREEFHRDAAEAGDASLTPSPTPAVPTRTPETHR